MLLFRPTVYFVYDFHNKYIVIIVRAAVDGCVLKATRTVGGRQLESGVEDCCTARLLLSCRLTCRLYSTVVCNAETITVLNYRFLVFCDVMFACVFFNCD